MPEPTVLITSPIGVLAILSAVAAFFFYLGVLFPLISPIVVANALVLPIVGPGPVSYIYIYGLMLMAGLYGLIYAMRFRNGYWIHGMTFALLYMVVLVWQTYYALFTVRRNHWGTR